ncbi:Protein of unknown function [Propionibacterium freudenreichii]|nr:Protein of unknown function [Propionibacterium freudenreichii]
MTSSTTTNASAPSPLNLGAYTACLHNYTLEEALDILAADGLTGAEVNVGGFIPLAALPG